MKNIIRKGINGDWKNILSEKDSMLIDEMMFFKWAQYGNSIKYYQQLLQSNDFHSLNKGLL